MILHVALPIEEEFYILDDPLCPGWLCRLSGTATL